MTTLQKCPHCGAEAPADAPQGVCPRCLLALGLGDSEPTVTAEGAGAGRIAWTPPKPDALAPYFPQLDILDLIGFGGMGAVYKARQTRLDRLAALKVLPPEVGRDPAFAERFEREAKTMARLNHRGIVTLYDFGQAGDYYYLLMEFVDGANLRQVIRQAELSPSEALAIVPQICEALQYAHDQGVVHRDIKPENVLLDHTGCVKIADFGLAKLLGQPPADHTLTVTGQVMGTPHYMAPEQLQGAAAVDHRADIYALGVVFYELLTGELPLGRFPPPSEKSHLDARLDGVVLRALERDPQRRYQHASEVKTDVDSIARAAPPIPAAASWQYDFGATVLTLSSLSLTAAGLWLSKSGFTLAALIPPWLFLFMAATRWVKVSLDTVTLFAALGLIAWGVWLEQSAWALLGLIAAGAGFGVSRHAYGRGWDDDFAVGTFLPSLGFVGGLGVTLLGMAVAESAWPLAAVPAMAASMIAACLGGWMLVDEEGWKNGWEKANRPDAESSPPASDAVSDEEPASASDDSGWGCAVWIAIWVLFGSGLFGFIGGAFGDLHEYLTEHLPVDPHLRRPAALGVYLTALVAVGLLGWGVWRAVFADSQTEGTETFPEKPVGKQS